MSRGAVHRFLSRRVSLTAAVFIAAANAHCQDSLADLDSFRDGCQALADERFDTAFERFSESWEILKRNETGDAEENLVAARLLESLVRGDSAPAAIEWIRENSTIQASPKTAYWMALAYQKVERFSEAADSYSLFLSSVPNPDNTTLLNSAVCLARSGREETAFDLVETAVIPANPEESLRLAQIAASTHRYRVALAHLEGIGVSGSEVTHLLLPLTQFKSWILMRTDQRTAAF